MAAPPPSSIDPRTGFCSPTKTFHSLRPPAPLPPPSQPLTVTSYVSSLLLSPSSSPLPSNPAFIDSASNTSVSYPQLLSQINSLASSLRLSKGQVAFVLAPTSPHVPVLYLALFSLGVVVSPSNPLCSPSEISHQLSISNPSVAFAVSSTASKLPSSLPTILLDSPLFTSFLTAEPSAPDLPPPSVSQSDTAAILYSSGTTGLVKGVALSHRNFISVVAAAYKHADKEAAAAAEDEGPKVGLFTIPLFHVFGAFMVVRNVAMGQTTVLMERFDFVEMLEAVERYRVTYMPVSPPLVVALAKSELVKRYDLSSLTVLWCGGAPLGKDVTVKFKERFPDVEIFQAYGLTESTAGVTRVLAPEESRVHGSLGRLTSNTVAKIVDPLTGEALGPGQKGELWLKGPTIMTVHK